MNKLIQHIIKGYFLLFILQYSCVAIAQDQSVFDYIKNPNQDPIADSSIDNELKSSNLFNNNKDEKKPHFTGDFFNTAVLKIINKKVGKMQLIEIAIEQPIIIDNDLLVRIPACWMETVKKYNPEAKALVEFYQVSKLTAPDKKFQGWLFSRNPASNYFAHEKYEFILHSCKNNNISLLDKKANE